MEFRGQYWFLSNFSACSRGIALSPPHEDIIAGSVESAYQASKAQKREEASFIAALDSAHAKRQGRRVSIRPDFDRLKVMEYLLRQKFSDPHLRAQLKNVQGPIVEENWWNDQFWGMCRGRGENHLGRLLMKIRGK